MQRRGESAVTNRERPFDGAFTAFLRAPSAGNLLLVIQTCRAVVLSPRRLLRPSLCISRVLVHSTVTPPDRLTGIVRSRTNLPSLLIWLSILTLAAAHQLTYKV